MIWYQNPDSSVNHFALFRVVGDSVDKTNGLLIFILPDLYVAIDNISPVLLIKTLFSAGFHIIGGLIHLLPPVASKFYFIFSFFMFTL